MRRTITKIKVMDEVVGEPVGGAHRNKVQAVKTLGAAIERALGDLKGLKPEKVKALRREKFLAMGTTGLA